MYYSNLVVLVNKKISSTVGGRPSKQHARHRDTYSLYLCPFLTNVYFPQPTSFSLSNRHHILVIIVVCFSLEFIFYKFPLGGGNCGHSCCHKLSALQHKFLAHYPWIKNSSGISGLVIRKARRSKGRMYSNRRRQTIGGGRSTDVPDNYWNHRNGGTGQSITTLLTS